MKRKNSKKERDDLSPDERNIIKKIDELKIIRIYLSIQKEDEKSRSESLKFFIGANPDIIIDEKRVWARDDGKGLHCGILTPVHERVISKEELIKLVGLPNAVELMEPISYTRLTELAKNNQLKTKDGQVITTAELKKTFPSKTKPEWKLSVDILPSGTKIEEVVGLK